MTTDLIPAFDPAGVPAPPVLVHVLLVFTFFPHRLSLNLTLGGTLLAAIAHTLAGGRRDDPRGTFAARMMTVNGFGISLTITTGVAPLLFIQVLYHQYFYPATILIGWMWFSLLVLLCLGYYAAYLYKFRGAPARGAGGGVWLWSAALMFLVIACVQVAVHLIQVQPAGWEGYAASPWSVLADPTYVPRLLHFVLAGLGFAALVTTWWAVRQARAGRDVETNRAIAGFTWRWALWTTALQVVDGFALLLVLPRPVLLDMMRGGAATMVPLTLAILLGIGLLIMLAKVSDPTEAPPLVTGTTMAMMLTIGVMAVTRDQLRSLYLAGSTSGVDILVRTQWLNIVLFTILLVAGLATVYLMVRKVLTSPAEGEEAA